jgi:hypothetical protein
LNCELISDFLIKEFSDQPETAADTAIAAICESLLAIMTLSKSI